MDVQAAAPVVGHVEAEELLHASVPFGGHVSDLDVSAQQAPLDLEAEHDVKVVRGLVGLHTDEAGPGRVRGEEIVLHVVAVDAFAEDFAGVGDEPLPEWFAPADKVLPHAALAFVDAQ